MGSYSLTENRIKLFIYQAFDIKWFHGPETTFHNIIPTHNRLKFDDDIVYNSCDYTVKTIHSRSNATDNTFIEIPVDNDKRREKIFIMQIICFYLTGQYITFDYSASEIFNPSFTNYSTDLTSLSTTESVSKRVLSLSCCSSLHTPITPHIIK